MSGSVERETAGETTGAGLDVSGGAATEVDCDRKPVTESVVWLSNGDVEELEIRGAVELLEGSTGLVVVDVETVAVELSAKPSSLAATTLSAQPTNTPCTVVIGSAKHCWPEGQTLVMTKLPWSSHFPTLPEMHAISSPVQGDEKLRAAKRLL